MCFICTLLDKSFPTPKQLAKAYFEATIEGVSSPTHYTEVEAKMDARIAEEQLSYEALDKYHAEFKAEYERLQGLGW